MGTVVGPADLMSLLGPLSARAPRPCACERTCAHVCVWRVCVTYAFVCMCVCVCCVYVCAHVCSPRARRPPTTTMTATTTTTTTTTETAATATKKYSLDGPHNAVVGRSQRRRRVNLPFVAVAVVVVLYTTTTRLHIHTHTTHTLRLILYAYTSCSVFYSGIYFIDGLCRPNNNNSNNSELKQLCPVVCPLSLISCLSQTTLCGHRSNDIPIDHVIINCHTAMDQNLPLHHPREKPTIKRPF